MQLDANTLAAAAKAAQARSEVPGMAVAVVNPDGPDFTAGFGLADVEAGTPCTADTVFSIASVTKTYTAALALALQADGRLSIDDPLNRFLPGFKLNYADGSTEPTLRDALTHRTGLAGFEELWYDTPWSRREILARLSRAVLPGAPKPGFEYSNLMVMAAGEALAEAAGMPYESALRAKLLTPNGDGQSVFDWTDIGCPAYPYRHEETGRLRRWKTVDTQRVSPALGLKSSAMCLATWMRLLLRGGNGALPADAIAQMWTPYTEIRREDNRRVYGFFGRTRHLHYGLGWFLGEHNGWKTVSHTGALPGFRSHVALLPQAGIGVASLANLNQTLAPEIFTYTVLDLVTTDVKVDWFEHFEQVRRDRERWQREADMAEAGRFADMPSHDSDVLCGLYKDDVLGDVRVWSRDGRLGLSWANYVGDLELTADGRYRIRGTGCPLLGESQCVDFLAIEEGVRGLWFLGRELRKAGACVSVKDAKGESVCA